MVVSKSSDAALSVSFKKSAEIMRNIAKVTAEMYKAKKTAYFAPNPSTSGRAQVGHPPENVNSKTVQVDLDEVP